MVIFHDKTGSAVVVLIWGNWPSVDRFSCFLQNIIFLHS